MADYIRERYEPVKHEEGPPFPSSPVKRRSAEALPPSQLMSAHRLTDGMRSGRGHRARRQEIDVCGRRDRLRPEKGVSCAVLSSARHPRRLPASGAANYGLGT